jgi:hypothetical protein
VAGSSLYQSAQIKTGCGGAALSYPVEPLQKFSRRALGGAQAAEDVGLEVEHGAGGTGFRP